MKIASTTARILLGLIFTVFGLNGFLNFIPMGPMPAGPASEFLTALSQSHYIVVVFLLEIVPGLLLLTNRFVPLALTVLAPVIVNIDLFHTFMAPAGLPMAILASVLWIVVAYSVRSVFLGLFQQRVESTT